MNGKIDHIGLWTWGGRVYNWRRYLDNAARSGMDTVVLWHDRAPHCASEIKSYASGLGINAVWGFSLSWNEPVCLNSPDDAAFWSGKALEIIREQYEGLFPADLCFQTGGTEFGGSCRLNCEVCRQAATGGVGPLYAKFAGRILEEILREYPGLRIFANVHLGGMRESYAALGALPASVPVMWEDIPGPCKHIEVPFAYDWAPDESRLTHATTRMVEDMCRLRGADEDVAFVIKGFPCHWGGSDPMLLEDFDLKALATVYEKKWDEAAAYCETRLEEALEVFRLIAASPARRKTALLLVEHGLWEYKRYYAARLVAEALRNPFRTACAIIEETRSQDE